MGKQKGWRARNQSQNKNIKEGGRNYTASLTAVARRKRTFGVRLRKKGGQLANANWRTPKGGKTRTERNLKKEGGGGPGKKKSGVKETAVVSKNFAPEGISPGVETKMQDPGKAR